MSERLGGDVLSRQSLTRRQDDTDRLVEIRCPTLVVAAQDEFRTMEESETLHKGIGGSSLQVIDPSGRTPLEQPQQLMRALRTLFEAA